MAYLATFQMTDLATGQLQGFEQAAPEFAMLTLNPKP